MTRATAMKRLLAVVAFIPLLLLGAAALVPLVVSTNVARDRIALELADWLDGTVAIAAPPRLEYAPEPRLLLPNVKLSSGDGRWTISGADISAHFDLSALVRGEMEFSAFTIEHPEILVAVPDATRTAWAEAVPQFATELGRLFRQRLTVSGGTLGDLEHPAVPLAADLSLKFSTGADGRDAVLKGQFTAAENVFNLRLMLADVGILDGKAGGAVGLVFASPFMSIRADGSIPEPARDRMMGTVELATGDLRGLMNRLGVELDSGAALGPTRLAGTGHFELTSFAFNRATIELDGNIGDGQLSFGLRNDRPVLEGTLAFDALDLTPYSEEMRTVLTLSDAERPTWLTAMLRASDVDLRLSAARVTVGDLGFKQASAALLLKDDDFTIDIGETAFRGGQIGGKLRLSQPTEEGERDLGLSLRGARIDIAGLTWPDMNLRPVSGRASLDVSAKATGHSVDSLLRSATGKLTVTIIDGAVAGGDLDGTVARHTSLPRATADESRLGGDPAALQTSFKTFQLEASIDADTVRVERLAVETVRNSIAASGLLTRDDGRLSLRGRVESGGGTPAGTAAAASRTGAKVLPFLIRGDLRKPQVLPNLTAMTPRH